MSKKKSFTILSLILLVSCLCSSAVAATPPEIEEAIEDGVAWLAAQQNLSAGYWQDSRDNNRGGATGLALAKLQERAFELGYTPFDPCYPYKENVEKGLAYLFSQISIMGISSQPAGDPDTDGDGNGVFVNILYPQVPFKRFSTYETGIALMAIAAGRAPNREVDCPNSPVHGWTYKEVMIDMVDYMAFGQCDSGNSRGGWDYVENCGGLGRADNSNTGCVVFGLGYAESCVYGFNCTVPQFVKDELNIWIDYIQSADGGSGYESPGTSSVLRTGNLIFKMEFVGRASDDPNLQRALDYLGQTWNNPSQDPGWGNPAYGGSPNYQAMFCTMKGLEYAGIDTIVVDSNEIDWYADLADALVNAQQENGSWPTDPHGGNVLSTDWALLTLEKMTPKPCKMNLTKRVDADGCIGPGDEIIYTVCYSYANEPTCRCLDINDVNIIDGLPEEVDFNSASAGGVYDSNSHTVTWNIGTLEPNESGSVTLTVRVRPCVQPCSIITNCCWIKSGDEVLSIACGNTPGCPTLTKQDNVPDGNCVDPIDDMIYSICYDANGYGDTNVVITDELPDEVDYISSDPCGFYDRCSHTVTWAIGTLGSNDSNCITLIVRVNEKAELGSKITNCCRMAGNCIDINVCEDTPVCNYVEDFEMYNLSLEDTWKAGGNATVSLLTEPPVHGGTKAMAFFYNSSIDPCYSEVYANTTGPNSLDFGSDWASKGVSTLSLWFHGIPDLRGSKSGSDPYTLTGDGSGINSTKYDVFYYLYTEKAGQLTGQVTARVDSIENTSTSAMAGAMIRDTLNPDAVYAATVVTPDGRVIFMGRSSTGATSSAVETVSGITLPHWVRMTRAGNPAKVNAEHANDVSGSPDKWTQIGTNLPWPFAPPLYLGLCVTSNNYGVLCTAEISQVTMQCPVGTPISDPSVGKDIGIVYIDNAPEPMYVGLEDNDGNSAFVTHPDPNATLIGDWEQWLINLNDFTDVNLADVQRMYIGFGNGGNPAPGGSGLVFIDDIQLLMCPLDRRPLGDFTRDCVVDWWDLKIMTDEWLSTGCPRADLYQEDMLDIVDFRDFAILANSWLEETPWP